MRLVIHKIIIENIKNIELDNKFNNTIFLKKKINDTINFINKKNLARMKFVRSIILLFYLFFIYNYTKN